MGLDPELVRQAERAKEHLAVAQHAAYRARVDYHHAIRRLHRGRRRCGRSPRPCA